MANNLLFISSLIFGIILIRELIVNYCNNYNYIIISLLISMGIITSILNHKLTNNYIKYLDRFTMLILLIYITYSIYKNPELNKFYYLLIISLLLYLTKYIIKNEISHLLCHIIITIYLILHIHNYRYCILNKII